MVTAVPFCPLVGGLKHSVKYVYLRLNGEKGSCFKESVVLGGEACSTEEQHMV